MAILVISQLVFAIISIVFGFLVLMFPGFLRFLIGGYFILTGILALLTVL